MVVISTLNRGRIIMFDTNNYLNDQLKITITDKVNILQ